MLLTELIAQLRAIRPITVSSTVTTVNQATAAAVRAVSKTRAHAQQQKHRPRLDRNTHNGRWQAAT